MLLWCVVVPVSAACSPLSSHWLPVWCPVLCKLQFWKAIKVLVCPSTPGPCRCLVWDFCRPFNGSGLYNGHIALRRVRQNTCQGWSRLTTVPVKVGGPLVTQCRAPILSFIPCFFWRGISLMGLFNGPCFPTSAPFLLPEVAGLNACAYLSVCVRVCLCQTATPLQWRMVLSAMSHSAGSLWHEGVLNVLTWLRGQRNADFISF